MRFPACRRITVRQARALLCAGALLLPLHLHGQRVQPLFEVFATYGRPALAPAARDVYELNGRLGAGGSVGGAAGVRIGPVEVAGFYEVGSVTVAGNSIQPPQDITRRSLGARFEAPLMKLGREFHGLLSASLFRQAVDSVEIIPSPGVVLFPSVTHAYGGRLELGVEHRGFIGTTWFVTGGVSAAGAGSGQWRRYTTERGGIGVAPIVTIGLRTREW